MDRRRDQFVPPRLSRAAANKLWLWILCRACGHVRRAEARTLVYQARKDLTLDELATRCVCSKCCAKWSAVVPGGPVNPRYRIFRD
jgi:hypothetical protein